MDYLDHALGHGHDRLVVHAADVEFRSDGAHADGAGLHEEGALRILRYFEEGLATLENEVARLEREVGEELRFGAEAHFGAIRQRN